MEPLSNGQVVYLVLMHWHKQEQTLKLSPIGTVNLVQLSQQHQHVLELLQQQELPQPPLQELPQPPLQELPQPPLQELPQHEQLLLHLIQEVLEHNVLLLMFHQVVVLHQDVTLVVVALVQHVQEQSIDAVRIVGKHVNRFKYIIC
jgi:hypothetical protein